MVKFIDVDPADLPNFRDGRRGRVSYPILKSFLETNKPLVMLDRTGIQQSLQSLQSCLNSYIRNHELPIKMFTRSGQIYLARLDMTDTGEIKDWKPGEVATEGRAGNERDVTPVLITEAEVDQRFSDVEGATTR